MFKTRKAEQSLSLTLLKSLLRYEPETGRFYWKVDRHGGAMAGDLAGGVLWNGYRKIGLDYDRFRAHRLAWFYVTGEWPEHDLDHINGNRDDNRFSNLREATRAQNHANRGKLRSNTSGLKGVHMLPTGRYRAQMSKNGQKYHLGVFATADEAHAAYANATKQMNGEFARSE